MSSAPARFSTTSSLKGPPASELLDSAVSLLRHAPITVISLYFLGALPFCLGLIYFCFDMSQSANAEAHLPFEAFALTLLYFWMKTFQAIFARKLLAHLEGGDPEPWTAWRCVNTALLQIVYAGSFMIVYPVALLITLPFGWVNAFYHTISIVGTGSKTTLRESCREAAEMAVLWPRQNYLILGMLLLALLVAFLNLAILFIALPQLLNTFFGIETILDENIYTWNNSSFYLDVSVFCFLILNPLNKAVYVLRCFYGRSRLSGADLKAELRRLNLSKRTQPALRGAAVAVIILLFSIGGTGRADTTPPAASVPAAQSDPSAVKLDQAIQKTLQKDEFAWHEPRKITAEGKDNFLTRMIYRLLDYLKKESRKFFKLLGKFFKWLWGKPHHDETVSAALSGMAAIPWRALLVVAALLLIAALIYVLIRHFRRDKDEPLDTLTAAPVRTVDLEAENVRADELPEESWLALAQQLIERGELRLALRALYLATLSSLARQQLVRLGMGKSNRDYILELTRRLRDETSLVPLFRENVRLFEAAWYGTHEVTAPMLETMRGNQQRMGTHAAA